MVDLVEDYVGRNNQKAKQGSGGCQAWQQARADAYKWQRGLETRSLEPQVLFIPSTNDYLRIEYAERHISKLYI